MTKRILVALALCAAVLAAGEAWLRHNLFKHALYSNSESIDTQLRERDGGARWKMIFVGDSEVRWGIDPAQIDAGFRDVQASTLSFNHAFDGFGGSWWTVLLPKVLQAPSLASVETVVLGVQMVEVHRVLTSTGGECGDLQRPVLTSPFAVDIGADSLCRSRAWDAALGKEVFGGLWTVRYAPTVRTLVLPASVFRPDQLHFNSRKFGPPRRGYQGHRSIAQDQKEYEAEFGRWKAQFQPERDFKPLPPDVWEAMVAPGGYFDELNEIVTRSGRKLALFALPTNPAVVDTFGRRSDYERNTRLLAEWAKRHYVTYVDLGLQDRRDANDYFSDMRHLSAIGAGDFSRRLGQALGRAQNGTAPAGAQNGTVPAGAQNGAAAAGARI
ncbi:MAG TPA: hypothetical protein VLK85_14065 [Ramlibacter sp.]|nr:hypothetical protein [Ramlibacter sp.]